jgi:nickel-type superoxide dismutase maturation protease
VLGRLLPFARYEVEGGSMTPALAPGERVLVNRTAYWFRSPKANDVVLVRDPRAPERLLVKRIEREETGARYRVRGDNAGASTDSRAFGPVPRRYIVGKVWLKYA